MLLPRERVSFVFPNVSISRDEVELSSLIHVLYLNLTTAAKNAFTPVHLASNTSTSLFCFTTKCIFKHCYSIKHVNTHIMPTNKVFASPLLF